MRGILLSIVYFSLPFVSHAQTISQTLRGSVVDQVSGEPLAFATVAIIGTDPLLGTTTDMDGQFLMSDVPIGRYDVEVSYLGYEKLIQREVVVGAAKEVVLNLFMQEAASTLETVVVTHKTTKQQPLNTMATVSSRMLSIEEASRYAGGFDDPARLAASFPGVASRIGHNGISVRGNAPRFLQWRIEGVEVPNPNHFANLGSFGGGGLTALSSKLLANSDFYTSAFPAEYSNALSGVFDIRMRNGNNQQFEHSIEAGFIGVDLASEGPLNKKSNASYLINYRYSTLGLVAPLLPEDAQGTNYQDLSFKLSLPTERAGQFSVFGIGLLDRSGANAETDTSLHRYYQDIENQDVRQYMSAAGVNHRLLLNNSAYLNSTLAYSNSGLDLSTDRYQSPGQFSPQNTIRNFEHQWQLQTALHKKWSGAFSQQSGFNIRRLAYDYFLEEADENRSLQTLVEAQNHSMLASAYTAFSFSSGIWKFNGGLTGQYFALNEKYSIEPRLGLAMAFSKGQKISLGYGLHSRLEGLNIYLADTRASSGREMANRDLGFTRAHHVVLAYDADLSDFIHLKIEPYFQHVFDVPIIADSTYSVINLQNDWFINDALTNDGFGRNIGLDLSLEQYMRNGFYFLLSASLYQSRFSNDGEIWFPTRYDQGVIANFLAGKEFRLGAQKNKVLGINVRLTYQGGERHAPIDADASARYAEVRYFENQPFSQQEAPSFIGHLTIQYEKHKKGKSHIWSMRVLNAGGYKEFLGHRFNLQSREVESFREALIIPNLSYRFSF